MSSFFSANSHQTDEKTWDEQTENENSTIAIFESRDQMHAQGTKFTNKRYISTVSLTHNIALRNILLYYSNLPFKKSYQVV